MRIPVSYQYKRYPGASKKLLMRSKRVGYYTGGAMFLVYAFIWFCVVGGMLVSAGMTENVSYILGLVSLVGLHYLLKKIREARYKKLDQQYMKELQELQRTNPQEYIRIVRALQESR